jgi:hypothetical protein
MKIALKYRNGIILLPDELLTVVQWILSVGKPRNALLKLLKANSDATIIEKHSKAAFAKARQIPNDATIKEAMEDLMELQGIGPATASAILALVEPEIFGYMYDETIETFIPKRS